MTKRPDVILLPIDGGLKLLRREDGKDQLTGLIAADRVEMDSSPTIKEKELSHRAKRVGYLLAGGDVYDLIGLLANVARLDHVEVEDEWANMKQIEKLCDWMDDLREKRDMPFRVICERLRSADHPLRVEEEEPK